MNTIMWLEDTQTADIVGGKLLSRTATYDPEAKKTIIVKVFQFAQIKKIPGGTLVVLTDKTQVKILKGNKT